MSELTLQTGIGYQGGRRYLTAYWGTDPVQVVTRFVWNSPFQNRVWINWWGFCSAGNRVNRATNVRAIIPFNNPKRVYEVSMGYFTEGGVISRVNVTRHPEPKKLPELMSMARSVAAGKAPTTALAGWIEDNWEYPWNLLATPDPIALIRELSTLPLAGV